MRSFASAFRRWPVRSVSLERVAEATGGTLAGNVERVAVTRVGTDTRDLVGGELFFALAGPSFDGHAFLEDARDAGAKAAVVSSHNSLARRFRESDPGFPLVIVHETLRALGDLAMMVRSGLDITVVGITGTTGKTSTKDFLTSILSRDRRVCAAQGSFNNEIGLPLTIFKARPRDQALIVEMGARRQGDIERLCAIARPGVGIITNIGPGHLELFKTVDEVASAKGELARCLPTEGHLVLNGADPWTPAIARAASAKVTRFGKGRGAAYRAEKVELDERAMASFLLTGPGFAIDVSLPAVGRHQVDNAVAAAACAHLLGSDPASIKDGLERSSLSRWRTERLECSGDCIVINDAYNANPQSMSAAIETLCEAGNGRRKIAVLGCMAELGPSSRQFHREAGRQAAGGGVDILIAVGRKARDIASGAGEAGLPRGSTFRCDDAGEALDLLGLILEPGDIVLVKASRVANLESLSDELASATFARGRLVEDV